MASVQRQIAVERLWELYDFDPFNGKLISKTTGKHVKGFLNKFGYLRMNVWYQGRPIQRPYSRVVWAWCYGYWPSQQVDHINRNKLDNRYWNLRDVSARVNNQNRGNFNGGYFRRSTGLWVAQAYINKKVTYLGSFSTLEESRNAYWQAIHRLTI
jgi:hypothetical protein